MMVRSIRSIVAVLVAATFTLATVVPAEADSKSRRERRRREKEAAAEKAAQDKAARDALMAKPGDAPAPTPAPAPAPVPAQPEAPPSPVTDKDMAKAKAGNKDDPRPWARGVSKQNQEKAIALFEQGNTALRESLFVPAVDKYRAALKHWDHPAIHYNLALALVNLDNPIEMHKELKHAMVHGPAPLDEDKYQRAEGYLKLVEAQLASVDLKASTAGAQVLLDGQVVFTAPGEYKGLVRIGEHTVIARKEGYVAATVTQKLGSGEVMNLDLRLYTDAELTRYRRPFNNAIPWSIAGGGVLFIAVGALLHVSARSGFTDFDNAIADCGGCTPTPEIRDMKSGAESKQTLAFVGYGVGTALLATGVVLLIVNRPRSYRIDPLADKGAVSIVPVVTPKGAGVAAGFRF